MPSTPLKAATWQVSSLQTGSRASRDHAEMLDG